MNTNENEKLEQQQASSSQGMHFDDVLIQEAYNKMSKSEFEQAAKIFNDIYNRFESVLDDKQKIMLHTELAQLYFWLGDYDAAEFHSRKIFAYAPDSDIAFEILGKIFVMKFKFPEARGYFSKISKENPAKDLGMCLISIKLRDFIAAEIFLKDAAAKISSPTQNPEYCVYHAYIQLLKGDAAFGVTEARALVKKCDGNTFLLLTIAEILMTAGNYGEADSLAKKVGKTCPENDNVNAILAHSAYAQEDYLTAENKARKALEINPLNAYAKTALIKIAIRNGRYSLAEEIATGVLVAAPEYSLGHANLGDVYFVQGRYALAEVEYGQTQQLMSADTKGARLRKARMAFIDERYQEAVKILEDITISHHTYYDDAMCDLLLCYDKLKDEEKKAEIKDKMEMRKTFYHRTEQLLKTFYE